MKTIINIELRPVLNWREFGHWFDENSGEWDEDNEKSDSTEN